MHGEDGWVSVAGEGTDLLRLSEEEGPETCLVGATGTPRVRSVKEGIER